MKKLFFLVLFLIISCSKEDILEEVLDHALENTNYCNTTGTDASECVDIQLECPQGGFEYGEPDSDFFCSCTCLET